MSKKRAFVCFIILFCVTLLNVCIIIAPYDFRYTKSVVSFDLKCDKNGFVQLFYSQDKQFDENKSMVLPYEKENEFQHFEAKVACNNNVLRLDFPADCRVVEVRSITCTNKDRTIKIENEAVLEASNNDVESVCVENESVKIAVDGKDSWIILNEDQPVSSLVTAKNRQWAFVWRIVICLLIDLVLFGILKNYNKIISLPQELYHNRKLIFKLAQNDFKTRYAGSYLGIFWAFIQPIVTIVVYWFVFEKGLKVGNVVDASGMPVPFVLWLTAGLVPWFFFSEALPNSTNALVEYSYLVKKVVFKISILPVIKVISALFVHAFFVIFTVALFLVMGYKSDLYTLQVIYYSLCIFVFVLALAYTTCAVVIFFRDLSQIINIILQIGMWMTPIMWQISIMPENLQKIFMLNPMYYIVSGYRDSLIYKQWFWEHPGLSIYFWGVTILIFCIGTLIFKKLKPHFADVL